MHLLYFKNIHDFIMIFIITINKIVLSNSLNHNNRISDTRNSDELPKSFIHYNNNNSYLHNNQYYPHHYTQQQTRQIHHHHSNHLRHHHNKHNPQMHKHLRNDQNNLFNKDSSRNFANQNFNQPYNENFRISDTRNPTIQSDPKSHARKPHQHNYQSPTKHHSRELTSYSHGFDLNAQNYHRNYEHNRYNKHYSHGAQNNFFKTTEPSLPKRDRGWIDNDKSKTINLLKKTEADIDYSYYNDNDDEDDDDDDEDENEGEDSLNQLNDHSKPVDNIKSETQVKKSNDLESDYQFDYLEDEPINQTPSNEKFGSLTEEKWRNLGTAEAVERTRRRNALEAQTVSSHIARIRQEAQCKHPRPKVIPIIDASKRYVPHCTILYRCGDDTGCCLTETKTCVAKQSTAVELYFYAIPLGQKEAIIETLSFINHTECHCIERYRSSIFSHKLTRITEDDSLSKKSGIDSNKTAENCNCVTHFDVFFENANELLNKSCRCDCSSNNQVCWRLKEGQEGFSLYDQRCISTGDCTTPTCQHGVYAKETGRCPRAKQKRTISRRQYKFD